MIAERPKRLEIMENMFAMTNSVNKYTGNWCCSSVFYGSKRLYIKALHANSYNIYTHKINKETELPFITASKYFILCNLSKPNPISPTSLISFLKSFCTSGCNASMYKVRAISVEVLSNPEK